ncbi:CCA tRNA nucleotidyltransferase [Halanaerobium hydrogeniformans]|uniref:Polynucleotide adenylyltransferase region n=1 Tax=Halanaerobium hydrogeniformans TaxID=656519 RepID=E4RL41_HALHG|nr:CCA tRNA nucleotidyltransferase [Halanaerobium hydrogeniformans]ADQ14805.1 Polynucleotide adenylyltransferase region [Halanaerobium hydrogeniformans]
MKNRQNLLNKVLNSSAEEYYHHQGMVIKINNLTEVDFKKLSLRAEEAELKYYSENYYLVDQKNIYFNKESIQLLEKKIEFLEKVIAGSYKVPHLSRDNYTELGVDIVKGLDLLKKYQKNNHNQASFLHYKINLLDYLPQQRREFILMLAEEAAALNYNLYLVGGQVRDLLIGLPLNKDLDLLIEGDLEEFFIHLKKTKGLEYDYNNKFSTGFLHNQYGYSIDIASCREEKYHFPGSLPLVEKADLFSDLYRRDFTINTLVMDLHPERRGIVYDFFGAIYDLKNKMLNVLHNYSFRDDPLRILRGIRFQILKDFKLSAESVELSKKSLKLYDYQNLAVERVFAELKYLFKAQKDISQFSALLLNQIPVLKLIEADFQLDMKKDANFLKGEKLLAISRENNFTVNHFLVRLIILFYNREESKIKQWPISEYEAKLFSHKEWENVDAKFYQLDDPALKYRELESYQPEELIMAAVINYEQQFVEAIFSHLQKRTEIKVPINGHDLLKMGLKQGPEIKEILLKVRDQILRNKFKDRQSALNYAEDLIKSQYD